MTDIYLYFRTQGTLANDDAISDSAMWPLSSFSGMEFISASGTNTARFYFKSMTNFDGQDTDTNKVVISDSVNVNLKSTATDAAAFRKEWNEAIDHAKKTGKAFFVVADDLSTNILSRHFSTLIEDVGTITVGTQHS